MNPLAGRSGRRRAALLAAVLAAGLLVVLPDNGAAASPGAERKVIVELSGAPALGAAGPGALRAADAARVGAARNAVAARQDGFLAAAGRAGVRTRSARKLNLLVNAVAMAVPSADVAKLSAVPGVAAVYPDTPVRAATDVSVPLIGAPEVWQGTDPAGAHVRGAGVTVAVIDTGVDYTHPDLGGGFGPGHKVVAGYDFVNGDADPMDDNGHGTHVAGIIAAQAAQPGGVTGVAPDATVVAYKVLDAAGQGWTSDIVAGIEAAADPANPHRADVINMSLGGPGDGTDPLGQAASAAVRAGVVVVAAAGNGGPGRGTVGTPAAADGVIAVGASASNLVLPSAYLAGPTPQLLQTYRVPYSANPPSQPVTGQLVDVGTGTPDDYARVGDVRGKVVRVETPMPQVPDQVSSWYLDQAREAEQRGAVALLGGLPGGGVGPQAVPAEAGVAPVRAAPFRVSASGDSLRMDRIVVLGMDDTQYAELTARMAAGSVAVTIRGTDVTDQVASFSSRGPSPRFGLKPELVAPGVEIRSTVPKALYAPGEFRESGTSMASPHVAGAAVLLRQLHPGQSPADVGSALIGTAKPLASVGPSTQGAGRLDVAAAARTTLTASPATLSLGLADLSQPAIGATATLTLRNSGSTPLTAVLGSATAPDGAAAATVSPSQVTVPASASATVTVTVRADRPATATEVSGWVTATVTGGPSIRVPYLLVAEPLVVRASPDPSDGHSTVFVYSAVALSRPPVVTVTPPRGKPTSVTATLDHGTWYRADVTGQTVGAYQVTVAGWAATGQRLVGAGGFEVIPPDARANTWVPVGPNDQGGQLTLSPAAPRQAVLTQDGKAGPWLTTDGGSSWTQLDRLPVAGGTGSVVVDAKRPERWWYAVNGTAPGSRATFDPTYQGKVLRTEDRGRTWRVLDLPDRSITALVADDATKVLVAATADGLLLSTDAGDDWTAVPTGVPGEVTSAAIGGRDLYLATTGGVWIRPDVLSGTPGPARQVYDSHGGYLLGLTADGAGPAALVMGVGVVGSRDGGPWHTLLDLPWGGTSLTRSGNDLFLATYLGSGYVGRDHGTSWTTIPEPSAGAGQLDYDKWADGSITVSGWNAGLYRGTADGTGYRRIGVQGLTVYDLAVADGALLAGTDAGVYRTALPVAGPEWGASGGEGRFGETVGLLAVSPTDPKVVWKVRTSAIGDFYVYRSGDGGATWEQKGIGSEVPTSLAVDPADPDRVLVGFWSLRGSGLFSTVDGGATWKNLYHDAPYDAVVGDPTNPDRLWLGNADGLYRSDDGGATVTKVLDGRASAIALNGARLVVGGDTVRVSIDGGRTFTTGDTGGLPLRVSDVLQVGGAWYAATTSFAGNGLPQGGRGVLRSTDGGLTWTNVSTGLDNRDATTLAASPDGRWLYVGTVNGGVHRLALRR